MSQGSWRKRSEDSTHSFHDSVWRNCGKRCHAGAWRDRSSLFLNHVSVSSTMVVPTDSVGIGCRTLSCWSVDVRPRIKRIYLCVLIYNHIYLFIYNLYRYYYYYYYYLEPICIASKVSILKIDTFKVSILHIYVVLCSLCRTPSSSFLAELLKFLFMLYSSYIHKKY